MWDGLVAAEDTLTALFGAFNALYFVAYWRRRTGRPQRVGAAALALVNGSMALEAAFFLALYLTRHLGGPVGGFFSPGVWLSVRAPMLGAAGVISLLIARQRRRER